MGTIKNHKERRIGDMFNVISFPAGSSYVLLLTSYVLLSIQLTGCTQVKQMQHLDELLVLKSYSDEKDAQGKWIAQEEKKFALLLSAVKDGSISSYSHQSDIEQNFGKPVVADQINEGGQILDRWLYRHPIQRFAAQRVYLYFDAQGRFLKFENPPSSSNGQ